MAIETDLCYRYSCIGVSNVTKNVSPYDMKIRLMYCGQRPINLLADLTNYLMLEMGQPMHAFDLRKVDKVEIKRFDKPFTFETLDQTERTIDENTLMICSHGEPVAVAGIMGGYDSEIADDTTSLLIESANFDGVCVRKSSSRMGLRTDASMRYEKMLDPEMTVPAIERYLDLLYKINPNAKVISRLSDSYVKHYPEITIDFDKKLVDRYTGIDITSAQITKTLKALGFEVAASRGSFTVKVPSWRSTKDVTIKADIIEEITRIYGYDNFEITTAKCALAPVRSSAVRVCDYAVKQLLCDSYALHEVHSYIWSDAKKLKDIGIELENNTRLINSINPDQVVLRRSVVPTLLTFVNENLAFANDFGIFEIGSVCAGLREDGSCDERKNLSIVLYSRTRSEKELFFALRDMIINLFVKLKNAAPVFESAEKTHDWQHPVNMNNVVIGGQKLGELYPLMPAVVSAIDKKAAVVCAEIDMTAFAEAERAALGYKEPSRFPGVENDITVLLDSGRPFGDIARVIDSYKCEILDVRTVVDIYEDEKLGGQKAVTVRLFYSSPDRTLTGEEVFSNTTSIIELLAQQGIPLKQ